MASPAPDRSVRIFTAFLVARAAFGVVYLAATVGRAPIPWYYPLTHRWELTGAPGAQAMGWFGLTGVALLAAIVFGSVTFAVGGLPVIARAFARRSTVLAIARAGGLVLLVDFIYFGWALSRDDRIPWTPPDCSIEPAMRPTPAARPLSTLRVPFLPPGRFLAPLQPADGGSPIVGPFKLDGELDEPAWNDVAARTHAFHDATGAEARPYSEARFLWDSENLYVGLYAADEDIETRVTKHDGPIWTDDAFALRLTPVTDTASVPNASAITYLFDISAAGVVMDARRVRGAPADATWESGIRLGVDRDGTLNDPSDHDEEWVIEAAIPWASFGVMASAGTRLNVEISRCDTPRGTHERRCGAWGDASHPRVLELGR